MQELNIDGRELRAELVGAFEAADAAASRFETRGARVSRIMAEWNAAAGTLKARFQELGNVLGSTFAMALEPAVQTLNRFMTAVIRTARTFRSFVWSLFGRKYSETLSNGAEAWDQLGDSASGAGKKASSAAREIRRSLMAFDQINRLDWEGTSSGYGSSGSYGSSGFIAADWGEIIGANAFGDLLHKLLNDSRFYEAGQALAKKLGEIVDGLDEALENGGLSRRVEDKLTAITELLNGFLTGLQFTEADTLSVAGRIGDLLGDGIGLALESAHTFLAGLDWNGLGTSIAAFVNGAVASLREQDTNLGTVLSDWLNAKIGTLDGVFEELDWAGAGAYVAENVNAWFENMDWEAVGATLRNGILGLQEFVNTALQDMDVDWHAVLTEILNGLLSEDTKQWFRDHPFWSKLLFGDENPFTVTLGGVKDNIPASQKTLGSFTAKLASWKDALNSKVVTFQAKLTSWTDGLKSKSISGFAAAVSSWSDKIDAAKKWISGFGVTIANWWNGLKKDKYGVYGWLGSFGATITQWWNALTGRTVSFKADGGVFTNGKWSPIQQYASGGMPGGGQLFVAREAGPELVGTLGGHTAVMNNDQIVASVSAGVARAIAGIKFYSRERSTPHLAVIGASLGRSEEHLSQLAQRAAENAAAGGTAQVIELLKQILAALQDMDRDVYLDGKSVKDRIVELINRNTRATGVCEIMV